MDASSIPSIHISTETDAYRVPPSLHYSSDSETTMRSEARVIATPSISQSSEAFDPHSYNLPLLEDFINPALYGQSSKDDYSYTGSLFLPEDRGEVADSQPNVFDGERLGPELYFISGPAEAHPIPSGTMDSQYLLPSPPSPSPSSSYNGSQSPASVHSEFSSDIEYTSLASSATPEENSYPASPCSTGYFGHHPYSRPHHMSSESIATSVILPPRVLGHHRSHSTPSTSRSCIATQAMLQANERRRKHEAQFKCDECHQTFTAQFSLKRGSAIGPWFVVRSANAPPGHQHSHTGERRFKCSIPGCGQSFFNNSDCKRHEKSKKRHPNFFQS
ncbi:hypothetical protein EDD16DRAFT_1703427 [Pisolithus croceorrhizus]|nr:hypothetical protein EDD16DRAFT_1703427 [Pisolithus croceorrhizus]KAI6168177.1 hypothetical protein EDD17DRAFT_1750760 [Pisolithus thermaeus]